MEIAKKPYKKPDLQKRGELQPGQVIPVPSLVS
jgi:hypothetical protein